jgi:hypothetical protein
MTAAGPVRDSALDAIGYAVRVLAKPGFLWVPIVLSVITSLPLLAMPLPPSFADPTPTFSTRAEFDAYFQAGFASYVQAIIPVIATSTLLGLVLGPFLSAITFRLGAQYVDGQEPSPFGAGLVSLAWRFFVFTVLIVGLYLGAAVLIVAFVAVAQAILGMGLTILIVFLVALIGTLILGIRLALTPVVLLTGVGPIAALKRSWALTRGRFGITFRWLFVTGLLLAITSGLIGAAIGLVFEGLRVPQVGQLIVGALTGPVLVIQAIVLILLTRVLSGPIEAPLPPPVPTWMTGPAQDQTTSTPTTEGGG